MSQGLSVQVFDADYVIQATTYLLYFSIQCFFPILLFHPCFSVSSLFLFQLFPFFPVLFQILLSVISFTLLLHLPVPLYCFYGVLFWPFWQIFFFETFSIMVGSCPWVMWIGRLRWDDKTVVVKTPVTKHKSSSQKPGKLPCLRSLSYSKNIGMCESFGTRKS